MFSCFVACSHVTLMHYALAKASPLSQALIIHVPPVHCVSLHIASVIDCVSVWSLSPYVYVDWEYSCCKELPRLASPRGKVASSARNIQLSNVLLLHTFQFLHKKVKLYFTLPTGHLYLTLGIFSHKIAISCLDRLIQWLQGLGLHMVTRINSWQGQQQC
jgi:hypothetical protein